MKKILLADDHDDMREACADIISHFVPDQFEIVTAKNGKEGLDIILEENTFFALITDFNMPQMNGLELVKEVIKRRILIDRIIVISGNPYNEAPILELEHLHYKINFLMKPFSPSKLVNLIS